MGKMMTLVSDSLFKLHIMLLKYGLPLIHFLYKTNYDDNNGEFRKRCKKVRLEHGAEFLLTSAFVY